MAGFTNLQIAELLRSVAFSYELKDSQKNKFRIIAYQRAADAVEHATSELKDLWDDGKINDVPGIGESIAAHLDELFRNGKSKHFEEVMKGIPKEAFKLTELPKVGIKTAVKMLSEENDSTIKEKLRQVDQIRAKNSRHLLPYASLIALEIMDYMRLNPAVKKIDPLGSLRRMAATVGDLDFSVATDNPPSVMEHFVKYPKSQKTIEKGDHSASILLPGDIQVDLMIQPLESYGSLLQHFTGSKHHNIELREYALKKGLSLNEYGIKKVGEDPKKAEYKKFKSEDELYNFLGLKFIPPELREGTGEIEASLKGRLPSLIEIGDIKADLQIHSNFDVETSHDLGESSMKEVIEKAGEKGYEYLAFTEHNPSKSGHSEKQIESILKKKKDYVDNINYSLVKTMKNSVKKVFNSLEIDIGKDGALPLSDKALDILDFALVSIHSNFELSRAEMTKRVLTALSHPKVKIFAHPTGRKINEREGVELNWPEIFEFCIKNNKWIEINADPMRLDLPDSLVREAVGLGVKLTLGTDAHHKDGLNNMCWGVSVARRGWAKKSDIINTLSLKEFEEVIKK